MRFFVFFAALLFSQSVMAASCASMKDFRTPFEVSLEIPKPVLDQSKNRAQLNTGEDARHREWLKKNGMETVWSPKNIETAGLALGGSALVFSFGMTGKAHDEYGLEVCPYFKNINIAMIYRTIIYIPAEYKRGSCAYNVIALHEMRHHKTNAAIVEKAVAKLKADLPVILLAIEGAKPYIDHRDISKTGDLMKDQLSDAARVYLNETIQKEMERENSKIDSPEEYKRGSELLRECESLEN